MSGFGALHLRRFREHPGRAAMSLAGIGVGSMLVVTMLGLFGSLTASVSSIADLARGADVEVSGSTDAGIDADVAKAVREVPGVGSATSVVRAPVAVNDRTVLLVGADADAAAPGIGPACLETAVGPQPPLASPPVALGARLARVTGARPGSTLSVFAGGRRTTVSVFGIFRCDEAAVLNDGLFVATTLPIADALTNRGGRVDSVFVTRAAGTKAADLEARVRGVVGDRAIVASPQLRVHLAEKGLKPLQQGLTTAISLAFVVAGFLVYNTMSMAALERRRELATLRAIGGRRRSLLLGFLAEATILGLVGAAIGAVVGVFLAKASLSGVPTIVLDYLGVKPSFHLPRTAIPTGITLATLATLAAAFFPARNAVSVPPVDAMRPDGVLENDDDGGRTRPVVVGVGLAMFLAGNLATLLGTGNAVLLGFGGITIGMVVTTAGLTGRLAQVVGRLASAFGATGRLAAAGVERAPRRVWATTLAVTVGVGVVVAIGGIVRNQASSFRHDFVSLADTDLWVQATTPDTVPSQPLLPMDWADRIAALPGVESVGRNQAAYMTLGDEQLIVEGMEPTTNVPFYKKAGAAGDRVLQGQGIIISKAWADRHGHAVGDTVTFTTPTGGHTEPIAAIVDIPVIVQGQLGLDYRRFAAWFGRSALTGIEVNVRPGADRAAVRAAIQPIVADAPIPINVFTGDEVLAGSLTSLDQSLAIFNAMVWVVVGATGLAILNTMMISVVERRRELGILRAVGTSRRTIRRMVVAEAAAITVAGAALGAALGLVQHRVGVEAMAGLVGFSVDYAFVVVPLIIAAIAAVAMTMAGSIGPALRAGRVDVIEAIGYE
jgi:putative ABC transport system permease protein